MSGRPPYMMAAWKAGVDAGSPTDRSRRASRPEARRRRRPRRLPPASARSRSVRERPSIWTIRKRRRDVSPSGGASRIQRLHRSTIPCARSTTDSMASRPREGPAAGRGQAGEQEGGRGRSGHERPGHGAAGGRGVEEVGAKDEHHVHGDHPHERPGEVAPERDRSEAEAVVDDRERGERQDPQQRDHHPVVRLEQRGEAREARGTGGARHEGVAGQTPKRNGDSSVNGTPGTPIKVDATYTATNATGASTPSEPAQLRAASRYRVTSTVWPTTISASRIAPPTASGHRLWRPAGAARGRGAG